MGSICRKLFGKGEMGEVRQVDPLTKRLKGKGKDASFVRGLCR
jgi:hypothetical protein